VSAAERSRLYVMVRPSSSLRLTLSLALTSPPCSPQSGSPEKQRVPSVRAPRGSGAAPPLGGASSPTKRGPGSPTKGAHAAPPPIPLGAPSVKDRIAALAGAYAAQPAVAPVAPSVPPKRTHGGPRDAGLRQSRDGSPGKVPPLAPPPASTARIPSPARSPGLTSVEPALGDPVEVVLPAPPTPVDTAPSGRASPGDFADLLEAATAAVTDVVTPSFDAILAQPRSSHVSGGAPAPRVSFLAQALLDEDQMGVAVALTAGGIMAHGASSADPAADAPNTSFRPRRSSNGLGYTPATGAGRMQRISGVFDTNAELAPPLPPRVSRASHARITATTGAALMDLVDEDGEAGPFRGGARASSSTGMGRRPRRSRSTEPAPTRKSMATAPLVLQPKPSGAEAAAPTLMDDDGTTPPPPPPPDAAFMGRSSTGNTVAGMLPTFPAPSSSLASRPMTAPVGRPRVAAPTAGPPVPSTRREFALMALDVASDPEADLLEGERTWQGPALPPPAPSASSWMEAQTHSLNTAISNMAQWVSNPGPAGAANCHVRREKHRGGDTFTMYLEGPNKDHIPGNPLDARLLLFARRTRGGIAGRGSCYRITTEPYDMEGPPEGQVVGILSSNFLGTEFIGCDVQGRHMLAVTYNVNILGASGPRKMVALAVLPGANLPDGAVLHAARSEHRAPGTALLTAKAPRWNAALQSYCLNFHGRVACASVRPCCGLLDPPPRTDLVLRVLFNR
jgi:hypothetical protein